MLRPFLVSSPSSLAAAAAAAMVRTVPGDVYRDAAVYTSEREGER